MTRRCCLVVLLLVASEASLSAENWPSFRGTTGIGLSREKGFAKAWDVKKSENILWKASLPTTSPDTKSDHNQSSPIVWKDKVFVTTAVWPSGVDQKEIPEQHVTCYGTADGKQLWDVLIPAGPWKLSDLRGGYAAPTPVTDGERVYVLFGSSVLAAVEFSGKLVWKKDVPDWQSFDVAIASSPILHDGQLLLLADRNGGKSTLTAYAPQTGDVLWERKRPEGNFTHTTPVVMARDGVTQLLIAGSSEFQSVDAKTGEKLWWCKTSGDVTSPAYDGDRIFIDSGRGGPGILIRAGGSGDVTQTHIEWKINQIPEALSSPVIVGDLLFRLHSPGVLKCIDMKTGKDHYSTRLNGVSLAASPIATADGLVYFASGGKSYVIKALPEYELVATSDLEEPSNASAALSDGRIYIKGQKHLFCIGNKP